MPRFARTPWERLPEKADHMREAYTAGPQSSDKDLRRSRYDNFGLAEAGRVDSKLGAAGRIREYHKIRAALRDGRIDTKEANEAIAALWKGHKRDLQNGGILDLDKIYAALQELVRKGEMSENDMEAELNKLIDQRGKKNGGEVTVQPTEPTNVSGVYRRQRIKDENEPLSTDIKPSKESIDD